MKKYIVRVNGRSYEVEVEEVKSSGAAESAAVIPAAGKRAAPAQPASPPRTAPRPIPTGATGGRVTAPMAGTILRLNVKPGDTVRRGDAVLVQEAMKMENEIFSPIDGRVAVIYVDVGDSVEMGSALVDLE